MCQRGGVTMTAEVCTEQQPSTSFATIVEPDSSHYITQDLSRAIHNTHPNKTSLLTVDSLPPEIYSHILKRLSRKDIDSCSLVCKKWNAQIRRNFQSLPKHFIRKLEITEDKHFFRLKLSGHGMHKQWEYKKIVVDTNNVNSRKRRHGCDQTDGPVRKHPNFCLYIGTSEESSTSYANIIPIVINVPNETAEKFAYKKLLHVPSMDLMHRFVKCHRHANIESISFNNFRLTDGFVKNFIKLFNGQPIKCHKLDVQFTKLKYVSVKKFEKFIGMFDAEAYNFGWLRDCCGHLSSPLVVDRLRDCAKSLQIWNITPEAPIHSVDFVKHFVHRPETTLLKLDNHEIDTITLKHIIKEWYSSEPVSSMRLCFMQKQSALDRFIEWSTFPFIRRDLCYELQHPNLLDFLQIWITQELLYVVTSKNSYGGGQNAI